MDFIFWDGNILLLMSLQLVNLDKIGFVDL